MKLFAVAAAAAILTVPVPAQLRESRRAVTPVQVRPEDRCTAEGAVVNSITGEPVRKATVVLRSMDRGGAGYSAVSDATGRFVIMGLNPGKYHLSAERVGFARQEFGAKRPNRAGRCCQSLAG